MTRCWKIINSKYKNINECVEDLKKNKVILSHWILDILKNKNNKINITKKKILLYKISLKKLGFKKPTILKKVYLRIKKNKFELVPVDIALRLRLNYKEQKKGQWLRIATPMLSMIDSDNVPHLPKLGKALNKYFIETYWSYPKAIFHPHNEFVVCKYAI